MCPDADLTDAQKPDARASMCSRAFVLTVVILLAAGVVAATGCSDAMTGSVEVKQPAEERTKRGVIAWGSKDTDATWVVRSAGNLNDRFVEEINGDNRGCSASLIGPRTALTAARCFEELNTTPWVEVDGEKIYGTAQPHPKYESDEGHDGADPYDIALIHLNRPVTDRPYARLNVSSPSENQGLKLIGFGADDRDKRKRADRSQIRRSGRNTIYKVWDKTFWFSELDPDDPDDADDHGERDDPYHALPCWGDAGGASVHPEQQTCQVGVHSRPDNRRKYCGTLQVPSVRVDKHIQWITDNAGGNLAPRCNGASSSGHGGAVVGPKELGPTDWKLDYFETYTWECRPASDLSGSIDYQWKMRFGAKGSWTPIDNCSGDKTCRQSFSNRNADQVQLQCIQTATLGSNEYRRRAVTTEVFGDVRTPGGGDGDDNDGGSGDSDGDGGSDTGSGESSSVFDVRWLSVAGAQCGRSEESVETAITDEVHLFEGCYYRLGRPDGSLTVTWNIPGDGGRPESVSIVKTSLGPSVRSCTKTALGQVSFDSYAGGDCTVSTSLKYGK